MAMFLVPLLLTFLLCFFLLVYEGWEEVNSIYLLNISALILKRFFLCPPTYLSAYSDSIIGMFLPVYILPVLISLESLNIDTRHISLFLS